MYPPRVEYTKVPHFAQRSWYLCTVVTRPSSPLPVHNAPGADTKDWPRPVQLDRWARGDSHFASFCTMQLRMQVFGRPLKIARSAYIMCWVHRLASSRIMECWNSENSVHAAVQVWKGG